MDARFRRFAIFYFFYYAGLGAYTPYIGRWVDSLGHGGYVVGTMLGLWYGSRIVAPPLWTALAGRSARPGQWFFAGCVLTGLGFAAFALVDNIAGLFAVMCLFGLFYNAVMPQFEAMTLAALGEQRQLYGRVRVWGSIGFLLVAASYGALLDTLGNAAFVWISLPLFAGTIAAAWPHRLEAPPASTATSADAGSLLSVVGVKRFLMVALLMQVGFGPFYVFFTLHLQANGHDGFDIGLLWAVGVLIEIAMFWQAPRLIGRFGAQPLLLTCLLVTVVRWLATAFFAGSLPLMVLAQSTHALSFAVFHACCMHLMADFFPGRRAASGQSLLYGFSSGVGGVIGAVLAAIAWEQGGGREAFLAGAVAVTVAIALVLLAPRRPAQAKVA
jgi:PPP family 3-phenylpropionic acid transporter